MPADAWLLAALTAGPRQSREVRDLAAQANITAKALRGARLRLGLVVTRAGNGHNMRSTWALPAHGEADAVAAATPRGGASLPSGAIDTVSHRAPKLTADEIARIERRAAAFVARHCMSMAAAKDVATRLVLERDRLESRAGSCIECQNYVRQQCPVAARPVEEIHECWLRRHDAP